ncbi:MAG: CARDB domain-containing protein [Vicinamibacteria bacterium]
MTKPHPRLAAVLLLAAFPVAAAAQDGRAGAVRKVSDSAGREVTYPTRLAEVMSAGAVARATAPDAPIAAGEAVLTKAALTHVRMEPGQPEAVLFAHTLVRFDAANQWLLRNGAAFVVNRRGKLALVVEGLETLFVGSEVYVQKTDAGLLAYVIEGSVAIGTGGLAIGPGQCARVPVGGAPERIDLPSSDKARVLREIERARGVMVGPSVSSGGGGGAVAAGVVLGLGAAGAGVYLLTKDDALPDLVPVPGDDGAVCGIAQDRRIVRVANAGEGPAPASQARMTSAGGAFTLPTPALAPGETAVLAVPPNASCNCPVQLTADAAGQVAEADEGNNGLQQVCPPGSR